MPSLISSRASARASTFTGSSGSADTIWPTVQTRCSQDTFEEDVLSLLCPSWSCASSWFSTARAASIAAIALSPALIASIIASICEAVVTDVLPESSCVVLELSADVSVLMPSPADVLMDPADGVLDSVDANLVLVSDVIIELLVWVGPSEKPVLVSSVVLGDERSVIFVLVWVGSSEKLVLVSDVVLRVAGFDSPVIVLLRLLELLEVVVKDWMRARAA